MLAVRPALMYGSKTGGWAGAVSAEGIRNGQD